MEREYEGRRRTAQPGPGRSPPVPTRAPPPPSAPAPTAAARPGPARPSVGLSAFSPPVLAPLGPNHFPATAAATPGLDLHGTRIRARPVGAATGSQGRGTLGGWEGSRDLEKRRRRRTSHGTGIGLAPLHDGQVRPGTAD